MKNKLFLLTFFVINTYAAEVREVAEVTVQKRQADLYTKYVTAVDPNMARHLSSHPNQPKVVNQQRQTAAMSAMKIAKEFLSTDPGAELEPLRFQGDIPDATVRQHILGLGQISVQDVYDESKQALCSLCNTR